MTIDAGRGQHLASGQGEAIWFLDTLMTVKAGGRDTDGALSVVETLCPAGSARWPTCTSARRRRSTCSRGR